MAAEGATAQLGLPEASHVHAREKNSWEPAPINVPHLSSRKTNPRTIAEEDWSKNGQGRKSCPWMGPATRRPGDLPRRSCPRTNKLSLDAAPDFGCMFLPAKAWAGQKRLPETGFHLQSRREKLRLGRSDKTAGDGVSTLWGN